MRELAVLVCSLCLDTWEPASVGAEEFDVIAADGCPTCGGWVWLGELVEVATP
ncbi:hypothetical protein I4I73_21530 [Pseudonocardia sp. KRD-184]|uniref:Transcription factor zinc-finger domain-containing protein n=1 Tax=Pseudonocardia oceani TaxID=2792013 RepID=A0ABS6U9Y5_9PSEU|nr:hypothetical protein [Pseudonocardia oceani]MBW0091431.1 hypothetical protein [Pseudonocardia oceani]MBW0098573.1 hypothetical protein [Pseudonocardia oceani]MBW0111068.1 hypothetical protein [Pseudonocardia oceani]MBW0125030.1 hypothetical protein [Pseudonocardia oceani]MBW0129051.1 hypothetical protein [Pseudonocardia oceani]